MSSHRILIDGYYLGRASGYGRHVTELCRALGHADTDFEFLVAVPASTDAGLLKQYPKITYARLERSSFPIWEQIKIPLFARRNGCGMIHFPFNTRSVWTYGIPTLTTVHDLTFLSKHSDRDFKSVLIHTYMRQAFARGTKKSDIIISVSQTTAALLSQIGIASTVVYNTADGFLQSMPLETRNAPDRPYFLHRGSYADGHRNTARIIEAFLSVTSLVENTTLKILGVPQGAKRWKTTASQPIEYLPVVSDEELARLYRGSSCVIAASLLEGFCLPIIEAFGFGTPVIASNIDPMKEIAGDAALLVDPTSTTEIANALVDIVTDKPLGRSLVQKGNIRLAAFSASQMAENLIALYAAKMNVDRRTPPEPDGRDPSDFYH